MCKGIYDFFKPHPRSKGGGDRDRRISQTTSDPGQQKIPNLHSSTNCWHDIFNNNIYSPNCWLDISNNIYFQKCIFPNPTLDRSNNNSKWWVKRNYPTFLILNIARIANAVQCHNQLSDDKACHEFRFSIARIVISVSNVRSLQPEDCLFDCQNCLNCLSCPNCPKL